MEELRRACDNLNDIKQCLADSVKNCSSQDAAADDEEDEDSEERYRRRLKDSQRLIDVTTEICKEDSQLHLNFVPDMACYREVFETNNREQHCRDYSNNVMNYLRSRLRAKIAGKEEQSGKYYECLRVLSDMNCFLELFIRQCSERAEATALEIIEKGGSLDDQCPVSIRLDILELIDALKLLTRKDMHVRQLLETDSFFNTEMFV